MKENVYMIALEYLEIVQRATQNGFKVKKIKNLESVIEEVQKRALNPSNFRQDNLYKAAKEISDLACCCEDYQDRVKIFLEDLGLESDYPYKILYEDIYREEVYYVDTELLYEDDSREELRYFSSKSKTLADFEKELEIKYESRGIRVLFITEPCIRKSITYRYNGLHTFNEYLTTKKGGGKNVR